MSGSNDFMKEKERAQRRLVATKKIKQGEAPAPVYVAPDTSPKTFKEKCKHFWFYYKTYTVCGILLLAAIAGLISQCAQKPDYDYIVLLSCRSEITDSQSDIIGKNLAKFGKDQNGDKKVLVNVINCAYIKTSDYNSKTVKDSRLQVSMTDADIILYITDDKSFERLDSLAMDNFFVDIGLPEKDGKAVALDRSFLQLDGKEMGISKGLKLYMSRRATKGTIVEKDINIVKNVEKSEALLYNIAGK